MTAQSEETRMAVLANDVAYMRIQLDKIDNKISANYVTKDQFDPVKKIVYGMVAIVLAEFMGALLYLVLGWGRR